MLVIDGSMGEGGGQVLRSALTLSAVTGAPFRITHIRANRRRPGLLAQHLAAVRAAAQVCEARVSGDTKGSATLEFRPGRVHGGRFQFAVGTAGSAGLVLQTVLPVLLQAGEPSEVVVEGGTHNPLAPPFEFLRDTYAPVLQRLGAGLEMTLERHGFYPAGGGRMRARLRPGKATRRLELLARGALHELRGTAILAQLPEHIGRREISEVTRKLKCHGGHSGVEVVESDGPGNVLLVTADMDPIPQVFCGFGQRGVPAETVADTVIAEVRRFLHAEVPVNEHLADQLILLLALTGGGAFLTCKPTRHLTTNAEVIRRFLETPVTVTEVGDHRWEVGV